MQPAVNAVQLAREWRRVIIAVIVVIREYSEVPFREATLLVWRWWRIVCRHHTACLHQNGS